MSRKPNILIVYTGGTIGMIKDYKTNALKAFDFNQITKNIPELEQLNCTIKTISFNEPIDSSNMNTSFYVEIAETIETNYEKLSLVAESQRFRRYGAIQLRGDGSGAGPKQFINSMRRVKLVQSLKITCALYNV